MRIAVPKEVASGERRVAATPTSVGALIELGHAVAVESGAGLLAGFSDQTYQRAGAEIVSDAGALLQDADLVLKVRPLQERSAGQNEWDGLKPGVIVASYLYPAGSGALLQTLAERNITALAMDAVPRTTKAQSMDSLSAMANIAGYRAVIEASLEFPRFFSGQMTAAGMLPPATVLVIGAGVAGLAAVAAARGLGAKVIAFDTRPAVKEQVESLGGEFLTVELEESGDGAGGYAKQMSNAFLEAEYALFRKYAPNVDIVITTALIPGKPAPKLWHADMVRLMKTGSVVVDLAGEQGGNCELTRPGEKTVAEGVTILGYANLPSRMASTASTLYANVLVNLVRHLGGGQVGINLEDPIVRAMTCAHAGKVLWPPPAPPAPAVSPVVQQTTPVAVESRPEKASGVPAGSVQSNFWAVAIGLVVAAVWFYMRWTFNTEAGTGSEAHAFVQHCTVFVMACFVGWHVIWNVAPALHTPLMAVTNAISGIIILGGLLHGGQALMDDQGSPDVAVVLGLVAVVLAMINVAGGFLVTHRMLKMFRK